VDIVRKGLMRVTAITLVMLLSVSSIGFAHSGRTDSSGGHRDNQNKSGLGSYHYHHGLGPHLHTGGVCSYETSTSETVYVETESKVIRVHGDMPHFEISVCGSKLDQSASQYPLFVYNDITYLPMTWGMSNALGITSVYNQSTGLHLTTGQAKSESFEPILNEVIRTSSELEIDDGDVIVWIDGVMLTEDSMYPFKNHNGVTYIPLTWDMAVKLGIDYTYTTIEGLTIK